MKTGLVARAEDRGISIQAWEFCRAMNPERILLVDMGELARGFPVFPERYPGATVVRYGKGELPEPVVREWLSGLDVVFGVETLYDWRLPMWASEQNVATVVQSNPEFLRPPEELPSRPTRWWNPTPWRQSFMPPDTRVVPVPVADDRFPFTAPKPSDTLRVLHVAGHAAMADRNGTQLFMESIRRMQGPVSVRIVSQDAKLRMPRMRPGVPVEIVTGGVENYWDLYADADVLVMPRRYGGLCLARSTPITMSDGTTQPISDVRPGDHVRDDRGETVVVATAARTVDEAVTIDVRGRRLSSSVDHRHLVATKPDLPLQEKRADQVAPGEWMLVVRPDAGGRTAVSLGPKPIRKGLQRWWPSVVLDDGWCRIIGTWLAEGHRNQYRRTGRARPIAEVHWSFGPTVKHFAEEVVELLAERGLPATVRWAKAPDTVLGRPRTTAAPPTGTWHVRCRSLWLDEMLTALGCGHGAFAKRAPNVPLHLVPALVGGWLDGDGSLDNGCISGFSRSTAMIRDMWTLCAKAGVLASITHDGQRLDIGERSDVATVASWTQRLRVTREYVRPPRASAHWRPHPLGWMGKVRSVEHSAEPLDVVALETESGRYIADHLLTHNCLPAQEAMASGLALVMSDAEPQRSVWPAMLVRSATGIPRLRCAGGRLPLTNARPEAIAEAVNALVLDRALLRDLQARSLAWAEAHRWSVLRDLYVRELEEVIAQGSRDRARS